ncbi:MAG: sigma-70 family RNA polymerase sigma factor [Gemmatimonadetes bacterium]|nr:sigma-70 family RNA polymerase sigma factor [Gemmatimonadota bacterium]NIQ52164.1 sigma-70 family RNA polymerase sigma factor [Gemmatimonadota bacterium]NIU72267.1 sigma-70 family RNA polymerase sigma factor [Gammaproteobacteria bacterium]NIX42772.1 sigma-70 family RNA polymerase sigma factor [Gemmatimonadota bacterium]NIY06938.1 sigma-70 family RNA polymerase sigma factor [Gemmatimonadota bacterium]
MDYRRLFDLHYPALFRYLHRLTGDADAAEDAAQEAFVRLTEQSLPEDEARPWLFTVATNLIRDRARKADRHRRLQPHVPRARAPVAPDVSAERKERIGMVREALDELSERDRTMLLMREEGFKYAEIARAVDVAPGSVGTLLARAARRFEKTYTALRAEETIHEPS